MKKPRINAEAAGKAVRFIQLLKHTKGKWEGTRFTLLPWQRDGIIRPLFGTLNPDGTRQIRTVYVEVPKKQGKSELAAAVAVLLLFADGEPGAEIYSAAVDREQAAFVFDVAATMVRNNPALRSRCKIIDSRKIITVTKGPAKGSFYRALSADVPKKHGMNPHAVIFDELHAQPNRKMYDALTEGASDARDQPVLFIITTAGFDRNSICYEVHEYALKVKKGIIKDPSFLPVIYAAEEGDDWESEKTWKKANPSLGHTITLDRVRAAYRQARAIPGRQNTFKQMRLCIWTQQADRWLPMDLWDAQFAEHGLVVEEDLVGGPCYGALDLSSVSDMTAWVMAFPDAEDPELLRFLPRFWVPEARLADPRNKYADSYRTWAREGFLKTTPGDAVDYEFIERQVLEDAERFGMVDMNVDALFQGHQVAIRLAGEGLTVEPFRLGFISFAAPMVEFERRLLLKKLAHGGNPILQFNADNLAVEKDAPGNLKPSKAASQGKIDGLVCMVMALERVMRHDAAGGRSVYEDRGIQFIDIG